MPDRILASGAAAHREEQAWNQHQLSAPVASPGFRLWHYHEPAVVLGCSQHGLVSAEQSMFRAGVDLVARQAGGGAVLVGPWMLSASIVLPCSHPLVAASAVHSYRWLGELFVSVLANVGVATDAITPEQVRESGLYGQTSQLAWACYGGLSPWEVVVDRRKIVGLAQLRRRTGVLLVAGLLLDRPDWPLLCRAMDRPRDDAHRLARQTTSCAEQLGRALPLLDIANRLHRSLGLAIDVR